MEIAILPQLWEPARPAMRRSVPYQTSAHALGQCEMTTFLCDSQTSWLHITVCYSALLICFHRRIINSLWLTLFYFHPITDISSELHHIPQIFFGCCCSLFPLLITILIIICSLILRPRLLLCFQVMYSSIEWFIGEERKERRKSLQRKNVQLSWFLSPWNSSKISCCSGGLSLHNESTGLLYCLLYFAIFSDSHIFWVVLICD